MLIPLALLLGVLGMLALIILCGVGTVYLFIDAFGRWGW